MTIRTMLILVLAFGPSGAYSVSACCNWLGTQMFASQQQVTACCCETVVAQASCCTPVHTCSCCYHPMPTQDSTAQAYPLPTAPVRVMDCLQASLVEFELPVPARVDSMSKLGIEPVARVPHPGERIQSSCCLWLI